MIDNVSEYNYYISGIPADFVRFVGVVSFARLALRRWSVGVNERNTSSRVALLVHRILLLSSTFIFQFLSHSSRMTLSSSLALVIGSASARLSFENSSGTDWYIFRQCINRRKHTASDSLAGIAFLGQQSDRIFYVKLAESLNYVIYISNKSRFYQNFNPLWLSFYYETF